MASSVDAVAFPVALPDLPSDWEHALLGDLVEDRGICYGIVQPGTVSEEGTPVIRVNNVRNGRIDASDVLRVDRAVEAKFQRSRLRGGEVLLTLVGTLGEVAIVPDTMSGWNVARAVGVLPVLQDPGSRWVAICLRSALCQHCISSWATTTVQATFNLRDVANLPIPLPPARLREKIAHILGTLDDKIELNRRMNATLEGISRAIFQSWFVDFDPVRQKAAGKQPVGMDAQTATLFPDSFEDSEIGEVPKGRGVGTVCDYGDLNPESWSRATYPDEVRYVDLSSTKWGEVEVVERHGRESAPSRAQRILRIGDTIFGTVRPGNGSFAFVEEDGLTGSNGFAVIRPKRREWREYVYVATTKAENVERLAHLADGGAYPAVRPEVVAATPIVDAPQEVVERFSDCTSACFTRIGENRRESRTLATLRDTLLPKLLSSEVRVPEAEEAVTEAVR